MVGTCDFSVKCHWVFRPTYIIRLKKLKHHQSCNQWCNWQAASGCSCHCLSRSCLVSKLFCWLLPYYMRPNMSGPTSDASLLLEGYFCVKTMCHPSHTALGILCMFYTEERMEFYFLIIFYVMDHSSQLLLLCSDLNTKTTAAEWLITVKQSLLAVWVLQLASLTQGGSAVRQKCGSS